MNNDLEHTLMRNALQHPTPLAGDLLDPIIFTAGMVRAGIWLALACSLALNAALIALHLYAQEELTAARAVTTAESCAELMGQGEQHDREQKAGQPAGPE